MDAPVRITRAIDLDLSPDELWSLLADGERWHEWLVDSGTPDVRPGGAGIVSDDGIARHLHVRTVEHGERITFDWWTADDASDRSSVELEIIQEDDRTGLRVTETFASATSGALRASGCGVRWDIRLLALHLASCALVRT